MISSHLLTTQDLVKGLLTPFLLRDLGEIARETRDSDHPSTRITKWFVTLKKGVPLPAAQPDNEDPSQSRSELNGDREELVKKFHKFTTELHENGQWLERLRRTSCAHCERPPVGQIVTSCMHLYCEECYFVLKNSVTSADGKPICQICNNPIAEAAYCGTAETIVLDEPSVPSSSTQNITRRTKPSSQKKSSRLFGTRVFAAAAHRSRTRQTDEEQQNEDEEIDWIVASQGEMPGAKVAKVRELVANWIREDPEAKVVVFTQFLDFVRIFSFICAKEGWKHCRVSILLFQSLTICPQGANVKTVDGKDVNGSSRTEYEGVQGEARSESDDCKSHGQRYRARHVHGEQMHPCGSLVERSHATAGMHPSIERLLNVLSNGHYRRHSVDCTE